MLGYYLRESLRGATIVVPSSEPSTWRGELHEPVLGIDSVGRGYRAARARVTRPSESSAHGDPRTPCARALGLRAPARAERTAATRHEWKRSVRKDRSRSPRVGPVFSGPVSRGRIEIVNAARPHLDLAPSPRHPTPDTRHPPFPPSDRRHCPTGLAGVAGKRRRTRGIQSRAGTIVADRHGSWFADHLEEGGLPCRSSPS